MRRSMTLLLLFVCITCVSCTSSNPVGSSQSSSPTRQSRTVASPSVTTTTNPCSIYDTKSDARVTVHEIDVTPSEGPNCPVLADQTSSKADPWTTKASPAHGALAISCTARSGDSTAVVKDTARSRRGVAECRLFSKHGWTVRYAALAQSVG
jgi:hypothetical protein